MKTRVIIESPFTDADPEYLPLALRDSLLRGEAPFASHGLYTQPGVLDDNIPAERRLGMEAGFAFYEVVDKCVVYEDLGISKGMEEGIAQAVRRDIPVEYRRLLPTTTKERR